MLFAIKNVIGNKNYKSICHLPSNGCRYYSIKHECPPPSITCVGSLDLILKTKKVYVICDQKCYW